MFKALIGKGHPEFSTNRQQDAQEFFLHLINMVEVRTEDDNGGLSSHSSIHLYFTPSPSAPSCLVSPTQSHPCTGQSACAAPSLW